MCIAQTGVYVQTSEDDPDTNVRRVAIQVLSKVRHTAAYAAPAARTVATAAFRSQYELPR
jgi:hypothetical protein